MTISRDNESQGCIYPSFLGRGNGPVLTNIVLMPIYAIELGNIHMLFSTSVDCLSGRMKLTCLTLNTCKLKQL